MVRSRLLKSKFQEEAAMPNTRSFLGHLEALRLTLESTREYVRTNAETFMQTPASEL
jgi:hypothetical protein